MEQLQLFSHPNTYNPTPYYQDISKVRYDPYWDEITEESENELLMVVNEGEETPSTTISKRPGGYGTGRITERIVIRSGKKYKQYWYDWQYYQNGKLVGRSKYISKRLLPQIQAMEQEKLPVSNILEVLLGKTES